MKRLLVITAATAGLAAVLASAAVSGHRDVVAHRVAVVHHVAVAPIVRPMPIDEAQSNPGPLTTCTGGSYYYAGYLKDSIPADGGSVSANVTWNAGSVIGTGSHLAGWVSVQNDTATHWLQAGVWDDASLGRILYIEYDTDSTGHVFLDKASASSGTAYLAKVTKNAAGNWSAQIGSFHKDGVPLNGMTNTQFMGESYSGQAGASCNVMDYSFANSSPWARANMDFEIQDAPYAVSSGTSNGWRSSGS